MMTRSQVATLIDSYLLGDERDRASVFAKVATWQPDLEAAVPIVRALGLIGTRAADESLIALRLILQGEVPIDERVAQVRAIIKHVANGDASARLRYLDCMAQPA